MFKSLNRQLDVLDVKREQLGADWDTHGSNALLEFYVKIMPKVLNAERCSIFIYDPKTKEIWLQAGTGLGEKGIRVREGNGIVGEVIKTGEHRIITGLQEVEGVHKQIDEQTGFMTRDILSIPIQSVDGQRVTGAVEILNKSDGSAFTEEDRMLLQEMAHYLELAIENIFFNLEATSLLRKVSRTLTIAASALLWIVGLSIVAIIGRVVWVGITYSAT